MTKRYSEQQRAEAVALAEDVGQSEAGRQLGISGSTVWWWVSEARKRKTGEGVAETMAVASGGGIDEVFGWGDSPVESSAVQSGNSESDWGNSPVEDPPRSDAPDTPASDDEPVSVEHVGKEGVVVLRLDEIRVDNDVQIRAEGTDEGYVEDYRAEMERGVRLPPVKVCLDGDGMYWLFSGFHRVQAATRAGLTTVEATVQPGGKREAILAAVGENATHGKRRTRADVQRAIEMLLLDTEWGTWSDRQIADKVQVDHKTVGAHRRRLEEDGKIGGTDKRKGLDGRTYDYSAPKQAAAKKKDTAPVGADRPDDDVKDEVPSIESADQTRTITESTIVESVAPGTDSDAGEVAASADDAEAAVEAFDQALDALKNVLGQIKALRSRFTMAQVDEVVPMCEAAECLLRDERLALSRLHE
ncbi:MAG: hypothetical protein AMXMBFR64_39380 [Myxococcales bacterium]